jgi:folate-binding protein YgfZ
MTSLIMPRRKNVTVKGSNVSNFMQGIITQDILSDNNINSFFTLSLNPQGKYESDLFIVRKKDLIILNIQDTIQRIFMEKIVFYKMDNVLILTENRNDYSIYNFNDQKSYIYKQEEIFSFKDTRFVKNNNFIYCFDKSINYLDSLFNTYEKYRITTAIPESNIDLIHRKSIPLEYNMEFLNSISWSKGCYLGQELTARTYYRGTIRKRVFLITTQQTPPKYQSHIFYEGKKVGVVLSRYKRRCLAMIRISQAIKSISAGHIVTMEGVVCKVLVPHWVKI